MVTKFGRNDKVLVRSKRNTSYWHIAEREYSDGAMGAYCGTVHVASRSEHTRETAGKDLCARCERSRRERFGLNVYKAPKLQRYESPTDRKFPEEYPRVLRRVPAKLKKPFDELAALHSELRKWREFTGYDHPTLRTGDATDMLQNAAK